MFANDVIAAGAFMVGTKGGIENSNNDKTRTQKLYIFPKKNVKSKTLSLVGNFQSNFMCECLNCRCCCYVNGSHFW